MAKTKSNDQIGLEIVADEWRQQFYPEESRETAFEYFTAEQILKDYRLDDEDLESGVVGQSGDGGIDSIYLFVNRKLIDAETSTDIAGGNPLIELHIIQAKTSPKFSEDTLVKFREVFEDLFDLGADSDDYANQYNELVREHSDTFRDHYKSSLKRKPRLNITFHYASYGESVDPKVESKADKLEAAVKSMYSIAEVKTEFHGAAELFFLYNKIIKEDHILNAVQALSDGDSYVTLCKISDFYNFITSNGVINASIFDANIRDYQGNIAVNKGIRGTLQNNNSQEFWFLNNGVTVLSESVTGAGNTLTITGPQIVNGLQTSTEIYRYFSDNPDKLEEETRLILVKALKVVGDSERDQIIASTNSQSNVPLSALRGTDEIHRLIEKHFAHHHVFYDRKKGFYKNRGKSPQDIVSLKYVAQSMMSTLLMRPDAARARPTTLLSDDDIYQKIFDKKVPLDAFLHAVELARKINTVLKETITGERSRSTINDLHWYVLAKIVSDGCKEKGHKLPEYLNSLKGSEYKKTDIKKVILSVRKEYNDLGGDGKVAKGSKLRGKLDLLDVN